MTGILRRMPETLSGTFILSILAHVCLYGFVVGILGLNFAKTEIAEDYMDLGYETFDEPPVPAEKPLKVMRMPEPQAVVDTKAIPDNLPKEIQDEQSDIAGTQEAKKESNIGSENDGTASSTPYYKIKPKYPRAALVAGTEGWVLMTVDINEAGEVENVRVVDGEQRNMFQSEARRAVSLWKYRPFVDKEGRPVRKTDHQVRVEFKLADAGQNDG
jgi:TonB family protein